MKVPPFVTVHVGATEPVSTCEELLGKSGVFALEVQGQVTHLSATGNLGRRAARIAKAVPQATTGVMIHCWHTSSKLQTSLLLYNLARQYFPGTYPQRLHLRPPWFVALLAQDRFPRLVISNRLLSGSNPIIGPFPSREAAQLFEERVQSAFSLRRCTETLQPSPDHPGCIYGEIRQCLRPCQSAESLPEYRAEAATVASFLHDEGRKTLPALVAIRDQAAATTDFELAAKLHKQIEKLREAGEVRSSIAKDISALHGVAIVVDSRGEEVQLFPMVEGQWQGMTTMPVSEVAGESPEVLLGTRLQDLLADREKGDNNAPEHLALFVRWYFSSWRQGEWVPFITPDQSLYRKLLRAMRKLLRKREDLSTTKPHASLI